MVEALAGCALTAFGLAAVETLARRRGWSEFAARKAAHLTAAATTLAGGLWLGRAAFVWVGLAFFAVMCASRLIPDGVLATFSALRRTSWGEACFPLGVAGAAWLAPDQRGFAAAILVLGAADTAAALAGRRWPRPRLVFGKTWAGSLACLVVAAAALAGVEQRLYALPVAALAAVAEAVSPRGSDNASVPITVALALRAFV
jgi:dolichol kinase